MKGDYLEDFFVARQAKVSSFQCFRGTALNWPRQENGLVSHANELVNAHLANLNEGLRPAADEVDQ
jgi:hypothetical protein